MGNKNGHIRTISRIERLLSEYGELDTNSVMSKLKVQKNKAGRVYQKCPTMNELSNLLFSNFKLCEYTNTTKTLLGSNYDIAVWQLKGDEDESEDSVDN